MEAISMTDVDQEEDEDLGIGIFDSSYHIIPHTPFECNDGGEKEGDDDDDDDGEFEDFQDFDDDYDEKAEFCCPYCGENFDILGLCCHIDDQHYEDAKTGICPICEKMLDTDMTAHIIAEYKSISQRKVKVRSGGSDTDCRPERLQPKSPSEAASSCTTSTASSSTTSDCDTEERSIEPSSLTDRSRDKVKVCEFVSDMLYSTMFNDLLSKD